MAVDMRQSALVVVIMIGVLDSAVWNSIVKVRLVRLMLVYVTYVGVGLGIVMGAVTLISSSSRAVVTELKVSPSSIANVLVKWVMFEMRRRRVSLIVVAASTRLGSSMTRSVTIIVPMARGMRQVVISAVIVAVMNVVMILSEVVAVG